MDIEKLLKSLTLEEKLGQLTQLNAVFFKEDTAADITGPISQMNLTPEDVLRVGSTLNFIGAATMREIQARVLKEGAHHIPLLFMQDVIHGYRTIYPIPLGMGCSFDPALLRDCARMSAVEAAVSGVHVTFGPMLDLVRDARWGRVMESTGEDPVLNARLGKAAIEGYQGDFSDPYNIATCVKHFAAYGAPEGGRDYNAVDMSVRQLRENYLPGYKAGVEAGADFVMPSFNALSGRPSSGCEWLLRDILRKEWGFSGVVISDYNAMGELIDHGVAENGKEAADMAFRAGCELEMMSVTLYKNAKELLDEGKLSMEEIDEAVRRVLRVKEKLGLFENPYRMADEEEEKKIHLCPAHRELARKAARESAVLLSNNGVLPFSEKAGKVAVIGPFATEKGIKGFWSCAGRDEDCVTVEEGIRALLPAAEVLTAPGCSRELMEKDTSGVAAAADLAATADAVVLCLGEYQQCSGEGNSRADLTLSPAQMALARAVVEKNPNTAVVLFTGRPLALAELSEFAPAILCMWQPGTEGGAAAAELLFGKANPCGKLSMSFPWCTGQVPVYYSHTRTGRPTKNPKEISKKTYSARYQDAPTDPLYVFGHGLSYTTFEYGKPQLSSEILRPGAPIRVSVTVRNTGSRAGKEIVQLYTHDLFASTVRPLRELKDFLKIELQPGEEQCVVFTLTEEELRFETYDHGFDSEAGDFELSIGPDSDCANTVSFRLEK